MQDGSLYVSKHGVSYISFHNMNNCLCFFNTSLHLLKTSQTLTRLLTNKDIQTIALREYPTLMTPLCYYLNGCDKTTIEKAINEASRVIVYNGYVVEWLLNNYYFPIIYYLINIDDSKTVKAALPEQRESTMLAIWREMSMEKHLLKKTDDYDVFEHRQWLTAIALAKRTQERTRLQQLRQAYNKSLTRLINMYDDTNLAYDCVIMEVYPQANNQNAHVVAVIDGERILDREKCCTFGKYIQEEIIDFYKLRFDYICPTFANHIKGITLNKQLYSYTFTNNKNTNMSFIGGVNTVNRNNLVSGGKNKYWFYLLVLLVVFLVVVCVVICFSHDPTRDKCCIHLLAQTKGF